MAKSKIKKRSRALQTTVGIVCLAMIGFVLVWASYRAIKGFDDSSEAVKAEDISSPAQTVTSKPDQSSAPAESKSDAGSSDDTSSVAESAPDSSAADSIAADSAAESSAPASTAESSEAPGEIKFPTSDEIADDFSDAVFIGNSRTVGLGMNCGKPLATFYASTGLNVNRIWDSYEITLDNGTLGTAFDALKQHQFKRVYLMFGINEIAWPYLNVFQEMYEKVINEVKTIQPNATVYVQSVLPVSPLAVNTNEVFTTANVDNLNETYIKGAAANTGATYLDVNSALRDATGGLPLDASTDGIHLGRNYCLLWLKYLADHV
ncbi:MAG: hypothetical protein IKP47_06025 [Ruminococcus sp.]|nr:hypothetical protein [Ruminococcus sp.]